jgi:hypothetical protein
MGSPVQTLIDNADYEPVPPAPVLSLMDRCDRCIQRAWVRVANKKGLPLQFCAHHARKFEASLIGFAQDTIDETDNGFSRDK